MNKVAKTTIKPAAKPSSGNKGVFDMLKSIDKAEDADGAIKVPVMDIEPDPDQPRKEFDAERIENLAASMREYGVIQPITVRRTGAIPAYRIISGERRWRAAQLAELAEIPVFLRDDLGENSEKRALAQLIENTNRADLSDYELAKSIQQLIDASPDPAAHGLKSEIARNLDRSPAAVTRLLTMLDTEWVGLVQEGVIASANALALFRSAEADVRASLVVAAKEAGKPITSSEVREAVKASKEPVAAVAGLDAGADVGAVAGLDAAAGFDAGAGDDAGAGADAGFNDQAGGDTSASRSSAANGSAGSSPTTRNKAVSLSATGEDLEALLRYLVDKNADKLEVRIPHDLAVAVIENLGGEVPDSADHYSSTIRLLLDAKLGKA